MALYTSQPDIFAMDARKTPQRNKYLQQLGLSNEQFEGWFKMFERDPRKSKILQKYEWRGNRAIDSTEATASLSQEATPVNTHPSTHASSRGRGKPNRKKAHIKKMSKGMF